MLTHPTRPLGFELMPGTVFSPLVATIEARCCFLHGHSERVATYSDMIALALGFGDIDLHQLAIAALLHDIGKIGTPDAILHKPGLLTSDEYAIIKKHTDDGVRILGNSFGLPIKLAVKHHHEQWNGGGYPDGLRGVAIPWHARIIAVADSYDAMTSDRPYRAGMLPVEAQAVMRLDEGNQWDPQVVAVFLALLTEKQHLVH